MQLEMEKSLPIYGSKEFKINIYYFDYSHPDVYTRLLNYNPDGTIYEANFGFFATFVAGSIYLVGKLIDAMNKNS
jgi:hypothetical protein